MIVAPPEPLRALVRIHRRLVHPRALALVTLTLAGAALYACTPPEQAAPLAAAEQPAATRPRTGTTRMADTLQALIAEQLAHPQNNIFLNQERANEIRKILVGKSGPETYDIRNELADELLRAGKSREAIDELERLMRDAGVTKADINDQKKPFFDLLALAYFRLGEQENCWTNPAANVCILPLSGGAKHVKQEGARGAIRWFTDILEKFPNDRGAQWLLNIAYLQIGEYPDSVPPKYLVPHLEPRADDPFPAYNNIAGDVGLSLHGLAGGVSIADFNGDGLLDVFTTSWGIGDPVHLFLADGRGRYSDETAHTGLSGIVGGLNVIHADYDNDGKEDLYILRGAWTGENGRFPGSLLRNKGDGTFEDVTYASGLVNIGPTQTGVWGDFNLDGYLDLFVGNESWSKLWGGPSHPSHLFLNDHDGTFTEVAHQVGIDLDDFVKGAVWTDVNNDGLPDLSISVLRGKNRLYINRGGTSVANWHFEEVGDAAGITRPLASFPTMAFDVDNDGYDDLITLGYDIKSGMSEMVAKEYLGLPLVANDEKGVPTAMEPSRVYHNNHDGTFSDVTRKMGLENKVIYAMGMNYGDIDNDGFIDFYAGTGNPDLRSVIPNRMFRNVGGKRFEEVTLPGGFGHLQKGHAVAFADLDRDGDEDIFEVIGGAYEGDRYASVLFENPGWPDNGWITLLLQGRTANRSAIGARVKLTVGDKSGGTRTIWRTVGTGGSFGAGPLELHVGLGHATRVREVTVKWPDAARSTTSYANLEMGKFYHITQGEAPVALDRPAVPFRKVKLSAPPGMVGMPGMSQR